MGVVVILLECKKEVHNMNYTMLRDIVKECEQDLKSHGLTMPKVNYEISTRMVRALGKCVWRRGNITIRVSNLLPRDVAVDTVMHEMLHAIAGPREGHGGMWLQLARQISRNNPKYDIKRLANIDENQELKALVEKRVLRQGGAIIVCSSCSSESRVTSRHGILKNPERYSCKCGGKLLVKRD